MTQFYLLNTIVTDSQSRLSTCVNSLTVTFDSQWEVNVWLYRLMDGKQCL